MTDDDERMGVGMAILALCALFFLGVGIPFTHGERAKSPNQICAYYGKESKECRAVGGFRE